MSVTMTTSLGDLKLELFCSQAPRACKNFLALCASGQYDGETFYRNIRSFMVQGGPPKGRGIYPEGPFEKELSTLEEAGNALFCPSQEKFHSVVLRGVGNISAEAP